MIDAGCDRPAVDERPGSAWEDRRVHTFSPDGAESVAESFNEMIADLVRVVGNKLVELGFDFLPLSLKLGRRFTVAHSPAESLGESLIDLKKGQSGDVLDLRELEEALHGSRRVRYRTRAGT